MEENNRLQVVKSSSYDVQLKDFEGGLVVFLAQHNLPSEGIFVGVMERLNVFKNLEGVISQIDNKEKQQSLYLSKFLSSFITWYGKLFSLTYCSNKSS
jgi:hypothetical protein